MRARRALASAPLAAAVAALACAASPQPAPPRATEVVTPFHVIGHRGAAAYAPENTRAGVAAARALGAPAVELDVQRSRDGALVLFHDATLDAKTPLRGRVAEHDLAALLAADIGTWFDATHPDAPRRHAGEPLAALGDVLDANGRALAYHLEIKSDDPAIPAELVAAVRARGLADVVTVTSFDRAQLDRVRAIAPEAPLCWLVRDDGTNLPGASERERRALLADQRARVDEAAASGFAQVGLRAGALSREIVDYARVERGLEVRAWGVRSTADMEHAIAVGANGMTIDWPDRLLARLRELGVDARAGALTEDAR